MSLKYHVVPRSNEMLQKKKWGANMKELPVTKSGDNLKNKINKDNGL